MDNFDLTKFLAEGKLYEANSPELDKAKEDYMAGKISLADYQAIVKKLDFKGVKDAEAKAQAKADAIAAKKTELEDKKAKVKQAEKDLKAGKISQEEFAKVVQSNQYVNKESLNEETEALDRESVVDMAQMVADEFTKEDALGDQFSTYMIYTVGKVDGMGFELDTQATENTPEEDAKYGTGEGWGGNFRIKALPNGYEIRNSEKGGLVATMDMEDGFRMLSADESRAEMGLEEGETLNEGLFDTVKDKLLAAKDKIMSKVSPEAIAMFKDKVEQALGKPASELGVEDLTLANAKKVGALVKDQLSEEETLNEGVKETIGSILGVLGLATAVAAGLGGAVWISVAGLVMLAISWMTSLEESVNEVEEVKEIKSNKMKKSELKEMIKMAMLEDARTDAEQEGYKDGFEDAKDDIEDKLKDMKVSEAEDVEVEDNENIDVDIEKDIEVDDKESEVDVDIKASMPGESEDVEEVQALLMKAQEAAEALGDEKLTDQIGNTITYFTRSHVARNVSEADLDMDLSVGDRAEEAEIGLEEAKDEEVKENLNESVVFPMWNKIK